MYELNRIIKSLGIVFGDIGTSPIYTLTAVFLIIRQRSEANVLGVLSLIFYTLIILVTIEYSWLAMNLGKKGEGGTIVLKEILTGKLKSVRSIAFITFLTYMGVSLLIGDGVITPAISILSAVEGILLVPQFASTSQTTLIIIAAVIAIALFAMQKAGTEKVGKYFGPLMVVWFLGLAISGIVSIIQYPSIIKALNPIYAVRFFLHNGIEGFFVLSEVILCATGGEALYADMGHLGKKPIVRAWYFVFVALVLNYLGQGAFLIHHPETEKVLFGMIYGEAQILYIPFLIMSILATIIASQAMISGMFSIVYQGITTHMMPLFKIDYTSSELRSQIYISFINWFLLVCVLFIMYIFKESGKLAAAYGLAVSGTMMLTGFMMSWIYYLKKNYFKSSIAVLVTLVDLAFLLSNTYKIPHGGYWSIIIALLPLSIILIYTSGQRNLYKSLVPIALKDFLVKYNEAYNNLGKVTGTALFFARDINKIPPYIGRTMFINNIIYEDNIIVSIITTDEPFGISFDFEGNIARGLRSFGVRVGYMEIIEVEEILKKAGIDEKAIFYGLEDIKTGNIIWSIFAVIKSLTPSFVQFYKLPANKLHGVITQINI